MYVERSNKYTETNPKDNYENGEEKHQKPIV